MSSTALKTGSNALLPPDHAARDPKTASTDDAARAKATEVDADDSRATRRTEIIFTIVMLAILALIAFVILAVMNSSMSSPPSP